MTTPQSTYIIIPAFNEATVIRETVEPLTQQGYRVIVVDDASHDNIQARLQGLPVIYARHEINLGQGAAIQTGIDIAREKKANLFVTFDADGQHDPADLKGMIDKLQSGGLDIVFGSRFLPGAATNMSGTRRLTLKIGRLVNYVFSGILLSDAHNGLRVFNGKAASAIDLKENRMAHASEFLLQVKKYGLQFGEYPSHIRYTPYSRKKGQSLLNSIKIFFEMILNKIFD
jgi:polyprenyl-phospho-N-acetylgalactosaminyl synthase